MLEIVSIAAGGMALQSKRIEGAARAVASMGVTSAERSPGMPVRIGVLPLGELAESIVTLIEAQSAYRANAAVIGVAADMLDTLLDIIPAGR